MSSRGVNLAVLLVFLLTVPAGVFFYFTSLGYPRGTAAIIAGVVVLAGLVLLPVVLRRNPSEPDDRAGLPAKAGWGILIGFLIVMAAIVTYFMLQEP